MARPDCRWLSFALPCPARGALLVGWRAAVGIGECVGIGCRCRGVECGSMDVRRCWVSMVGNNIVGVVGTGHL